MTSSCDLILRKNLHVQVFEEGTDCMRDSFQASTFSMFPRCAAFRDEILAGILDGKYLEVSFDKFPYYLRYSLS